MTLASPESPVQLQIEKFLPESASPVQNLGVGLIALMMTTTGVPATPVLDSQIICESFTGSWLNTDLSNFLYSDKSVLASSIAFSTVTDSAAEAPHRPSTAESVRKLHAISGLTWEQLARLFGVSRRAVHHWASGGRMNALNEEQLIEMLDVISRLPSGSPTERRSLILATPLEGPSIFEQLKSRQPHSDILQVAAYPPDLRIG